MQYLRRKKSDLSIINLKEISLNSFSLYNVHKCIKKRVLIQKWKFKSVLIPYENNKL